MVRKRLSSDFGTAKELLNDLRSRADKADFNLLDNDYSLADLQREYLRHCDQTLRPKTVKRYRENLEAIREAIPATKVSHVTSPVVTTYRTGRLVKASPRTVNMEVSALSAMFNWGVNHELIGTNPLAKIRPLSEDKKQKVRRALTVAEVEAIFENSPTYLLPVFRMFATTGVRHNELANIRFADVDHERRCVTVHAENNKSHKAREIPLDDDMLAIIATLEDKAADRKPCEGNTPKMTEQIAANFSRDHVFVTTVNTPWKNCNLLHRFYAVCRRAGIEDAHSGGSVDIHALRVTFTTLSLDNGANPRAVQDILGHATLAMTMGVYAKATERGKREAITALPFAKVSAPAHVVSMENARTERASNSSEPQTVAS